jgi:hypothetical protein
MRFFIIVLLFLGAAYWLVGGLFEHVFFSSVLDILRPYLTGFSAGLLLRGVMATLLVLFGLVLAWPSRPNFLRRRPIKMFLERDSGSDRVGIHSFPGITYIQVSLKTSTPLLNCKAWITKAEYRENANNLYAIEHNERHPLIWSKHGGANMYEANLSPNDPPVRINIATFNQALQFDPQTPTNLLPRLQLIGFHRLGLLVTGEHCVRLFGMEYKFTMSETKSLIIDWRGPNVGAFVSIE